MKFELTKDWCVRMAQLEMEAGSDMEIGSNPAIRAASPEVRAIALQISDVPDANVAFGRFVRLMRRSRRQSIEHLADEAEVELSELFEIEEDNHHRPEPRTVYQLANHFRVPTGKLMQLAGLSAPKDNRLFEEAIRFAARSEVVEDLSEIERAALEAFVAVLSEKQ
jgi:transcriptional regulator with XRE-family HTH domain